MITQERLKDLVTRMRIRALVFEGVDEEVRLAESRQEFKLGQEKYKKLTADDTKLIDELESEKRSDLLDNLEYERKRVTLQEAKVAYINEAINKLVESGS